MAAQFDVINVTRAGSCPKVEMPEVLAASDVCTATLQDIPMFRTTFPNNETLCDTLMIDGLVTK
jgi:hypothetical protein